MIYLGTIVIGSIVFGLIINQLPANWFIIPGQAGTHAHHLLPGWLQFGSAILLILLIINGYYQRYFKTKTKKTEIMNTENEKNQFGKSEWHGLQSLQKQCRTKSEKKLPEIQTVEADLSTQTVRIEGENVKMENVREVVESLGYKFIGKAEE